MSFPESYSRDLLLKISKSKHLGFGVYGSLFQSMKRSDVNECINILKDEGIIKQQGVRSYTKYQTSCIIF